MLAGGDLTRLAALMRDAESALPDRRTVDLGECAGVRLDGIVLCGPGSETGADTSCHRLSSGGDCGCTTGCGKKSAAESATGMVGRPWQ